MVLSIYGELEVGDASHVQVGLLLDSLYPLYHLLLLLLRCQLLSHLLEIPVELVRSDVPLPIVAHTLAYVLVIGMAVGRELGLLLMGCGL